MQRVKRSTAVAVLPAAPAGGTAGFFAAPNPQGGPAATVPGYEWYNNMQEEVCSVIEGAGIPLSDSDRTQLRQAIQAMIVGAQKAVAVSGAAFDASVVTGEAVRWDSVNNVFDEAIADGTANNRAIGIADLTNSKVYIYGECPLFSGLTPGARYYLDAATPGALTTVAPADGVVIGIAKTATTLFVDIDALGVRTDQANFYTAGQAGTPKPLPATTGTVTLNLSQGNNWEGTLTGNITLANPSSMPIGQTGYIRIINPGPYTISYGSYWKATGGSLPGLTPTAGAEDLLGYAVKSSTSAWIGILGDVK